MDVRSAVVKVVPVKPKEAGVIVKAFTFVLRA